MAPITSLPDLDTLDVFSYYDPDGDAMINIVSDDNTHPRVVDDYVIDPADWKATNRDGLQHGNESGPPIGVKTVEDVLTHNTGNLGCFVCGKKGFACNGRVCIDIAKDRFQNLAKSALQIRKARWGFGVFAREDIPRGTMIGEYIGRLLPHDPDYSAQSAYVYTIGRRAECDAEQYCNITHFINHNCICNTDPISAMYGKREVVALKTNRDIAAGEEITIDYGTEYFNKNFPCHCDTFEYPHTSETYRRRVSPDGSNVSLQGFRTSGCQKKKPLFGPLKKSVRQGPLPKTLKTGKPESGLDGALRTVASHRVKRRRFFTQMGREALSHLDTLK
ncbi:set-domain histone methyltransferase-5 [Diaporthe helianthi]|uniref:Set-domain histone methyltransferase-5 n=1 Tax=Diaporthe helianthi TaxID=158607 RepID=A0A2P5HXT0_DIAHE|nr:set-domain histone methyltransferase-5 [Diaporthe helianthi]